MCPQIQFSKRDNGTQWGKFTFAWGDILWLSFGGGILGTFTELGEST